MLADCIDQCIHFTLGEIGFPLFHHNTGAHHRVRHVGHIGHAGHVHVDQVGPVGHVLEGHVGEDGHRAAPLVGAAADVMHVVGRTARHVPGIIRTHDEAVGHSTLI